MAHALRQAFLRTLTTQAPAPPERRDLPTFSSRVGRLFHLLERAQLPFPSEEEAKKLLPFQDPELRALVSDCAALLERMPGLGEPLGLSAGLLRELLQTDLELGRLSALCDDLHDAAVRAGAALWGALGAWNARILYHVQQRIDDQALPLAERHRLLSQFGGALEEAERSTRPLRATPPRSVAKKAEALRQRIEAADRSKAVAEALRLLRRLADKDPEGARP